MPKFRKKPVVIEAVHYDGTDEGYERVCAFAPGVHFDPIVYADDVGVKGKGRFHVPTLEGPHVASPGDWIIRGVQGELYPCKPDIFAATYEAVAERSQEEHVDAREMARYGHGVGSK